MEISFLSKEEYTIQGVYVENLHNRPYCIFDLEGTGIHVETEYITQIAAILFQNGQIIGKFDSLVKSPKLIPDAIEKLTGITNEEMLHAPAFPEVYKQFLDFCGEAVLVTQAGYEYDLPMLDKHCRIHGLQLFPNTVIDTKALFANVHREWNDIFSTDYLINYYKIGDNDVPRHNALGDCILISRIFQNILQDYSNKDMKSFELEKGLTIKRFVMPKSDLDEDNGGSHDS
ncbi:3'-5' exonuclease [Paenibacillus hodogayensis]|uniref:3'-5' exonuclease n=1 Tax=Paenibacillus hodogayensis TaxID=279208 RepID=A0ABV5VVN8_9BACL